MSDKLIFVVSYYELIFDQGNYALDWHEINNACCVVPDDKGKC